MPRLSPAILAGLLSTLLGCAGPARSLYDPAAFRGEVHARAPALRPDEIIVPFEIPEPLVARAQKIAEPVNSERERVRLLVGTMFKPTGLALGYAARATTGGAAETLARRAGNCLDLASVFVGLSRAVGLRSSYIDASRHVHETRTVGDGLTVFTGHVTAVVQTDAGAITLDFASEGEIVSYRVISDLEALANFYNNRGFERIESAEERHESADWDAASRDFERAVVVFPAFARAWNNLGIAAARLGRPDDAVAHYRQAIARDPGFAAPHKNLAVLLLQGGDREGARAELQRAIALRRDDREAEALLRSLD